MGSAAGGRRSEYHTPEIGRAGYRNGEPRRDTSQLKNLNSE